MSVPTSKVGRIQEDKDRPLARRYVKVIPPPIRQVGANYDAQLPDKTSDDDDDYYQLVRQPLQQLPVTQQGDCHDNVMVQDTIASNEQGQPLQ